MVLFVLGECKDMKIRKINRNHNFIILLLVNIFFGCYSSNSESVDFVVDVDEFVKIHEIQKVEKKNINIPVILNDVFCLVFETETTVYVDNILQENNLGKNNQSVLFFLQHMIPGWHELKIQDKDGIERYYLNIIMGSPNVIVSEALVNNGRNFKKNVFQNKYKKYLQDNYSIYFGYFGSYGNVYTDLTLDKNGIPMVTINNKNEYNPVAISQYALSFYNSYEAITQSEKEKFLNCADFLCNYVNDDGGAPYNFDFTMHGILLKAPWFSSMAQGQILSVLSRAFLLTKSEKYKTSGDKIVKFMVSSCKTDLSQLALANPSFSLYKDYIIYEEYKANIDSFVLNGNLFGLIGLHDWWEATYDVLSFDSFLKGCRTIELLLPYYDFYGSTSYDLVHYITGNYVNFDSQYAHDYHIACLDALYFYTYNKTFKQYEERFISYYEDSKFN